MALFDIYADRWMFGQERAVWNESGRANVDGKMIINRKPLLRGEAGDGHAIC